MNRPAPTRRELLTLGAGAAALGLGAPVGAREEDALARELERFAHLQDGTAGLEPISAAERAARRARLGRILTAAGFDAILMEGGATMSWLSDVSWGHTERLFGLVVLSDGSHFWICPGFEAEKAKLRIQGEGGPGGEIVTWQEHEYPFAPLAAALAERGAERLAIEPSLRHRFAHGISAELGAAKVGIGLEVVVELQQPIDAVVAPNGEWWIAERPGRVVVVDPESGAVGDTVVAIDDETRAAGERGLLGLAVDETALYVNFTDGAGNTRIDAFVLDDVGRPGERISLLTIEQPFGNHNGGSLAIGPDGHLYIGVGDGGGGGDPLDAAQDPTQALGSILRIDPTLGAERPYVAPDDNPYGDDGTVAEIFLTGVRNPWRFTFDPVTGDLWVADVGQNAWEEVTLLLAANGGGRGANLGWNLREGVEPFAGDRPPGNVDPVFVYGREGTPSGCSVTGGEVYRAP